MVDDKPVQADTDTDTGTGTEATSSIDLDILVDEHEEEISVGGKTERHRGIYLLPNLFTTAALFAGFYAIVAAIRGQFEPAAIAICFAGFFDGLDGRIARLTNTSSKFGEEYDSLSDMVSFGVAPALVVFTWGLGELGKFGWSVAFIFVACAALRLARFNAQIEETDRMWFTGLASPAAAGGIASTVWVCHDLGWVGAAVPFEAAVAVGILTALIGLLMVINVPYYSGKGLDAGGRVPFVAMLAVVFLFSLVTLDPPKVLLATFVIYASSGPVWLIVKGRKT